MESPGAPILPLQGEVAARSAAGEGPMDGSRPHPSRRKSGAPPSPEGRDQAVRRSNLIFITLSLPTA
jgi:hypothetical protein